MCGINLFIDKRPNTDNQVISKMNRSILHRGPDASNFSTFSPNNSTIYIGNNRLKIVDPSSESNQPFSSSDNRYHISFNGEIYNYKKLKTKLQVNYYFRTDSDTEVLLYHLIENGVKGIEELNGMFAFIFYDSLTNETIVVRDKHGIKPLYYFHNNTFYLVSSEIKGILASGLVKKELNETQIPHYLNYKYAERPETFYKNIYELEPGWYAEITDNTFQIKKWASEISIPNTPVDIAYTESKIESLLIDAVTNQLDTTTPSGVFLSGGVDSTLLLAISSTLGGKYIPSFSICNSDSDKNYGTEDYKYAKRAADKYNSPFHEIEIDSFLLNQVDELCRILDQPIGDTALLLTWILSKNASTEVRVALSGAGADEWFAGYNRHWAFQKYHAYFYKNNTFLKLAKLTSRVLPDGFSHPYRKQIRLWNKFTDSITDQPEETFHGFRSTGWEKRNLTNLVGLANNFTLHDVLQHDQKNYLVSDVLALTDKTSMSQSLEVRVPYLDKNITDFLTTLPSNFFIENGQKWILKSLLTKLGGKEFTTRTKEGFGLPFGKWIREPQHQNLINELLNKNNTLYQYIDYNTVFNLIEEHMQFKKDNTTLLWSIILLSKWIAIEFE